GWDDNARFLGAAHVLQLARRVDIARDRKLEAVGIHGPLAERLCSRWREGEREGNLARSDFTVRVLAIVERVREFPAPAVADGPLQSPFARRACERTEDADGDLFQAGALVLFDSAVTRNVAAP